MLEIVSAAIVYGLAAGLGPGPLLTLVITQTLRHGAREGMKTAMAPLISDGPIIALLLVFIGQLARVKPVVGAVAFGGALYLLWLAYEGWTAKPPDATPSTAPPRSFIKGALVNLLNPNPYLFWLTVGVPMLVKAWTRSSHTAAVVFVLVFFVCLVGSKMLLANVVARSREHVAGRWHTVAMRTLALLLVLFAAIMARDGWRLLGRPCHPERDNGAARRCE